MASQKLLDFLNNGIARELQVSIQYMWQHIQVTGTDGVIVEDIFRKTAIAQMKHAERLAERLDYLNGVATTKPDPIFVRGSLIEMLKQNEQDEEKAINTLQTGNSSRCRRKATTPQGVCSRKFSLKKKPTSNIFGKLLVGMTEPFTQPGTSQIE